MNVRGQFEIDNIKLMCTFVRQRKQDIVSFRLFAQLYSVHHRQWFWVDSQADNERLMIYRIELNISLSANQCERQKIIIFSFFCCWCGEYTFLVFIMSHVAGRQAQKLMIFLSFDKIDLCIVGRHYANWQVVLIDQYAMNGRIISHNETCN